MKVTLIIFVLLISLLLVWFFIQGYLSRSGTAAGLESGRLSACPNQPNCVCSEDKADAESFIAPIFLSVNNHAEAWEVVQETIVVQGGQLNTEDSDYLSATFESSVFGFVDDLEVRFDSQQSVFHIRSASRVGHSDFGVNRKRVERLITTVQEKLPGLVIRD